MKDITTIAEKGQSLCLQSIRELCRVFWGPDLQHCREMLGGAFLRPFSASTEVFNQEAEISGIQHFFSGFDDEHRLYAFLDETFIRLFVSTRGRIIPPYQSCYENDGRLMMGPGAVEMKKRLAARGLAVDGQLNEPPDHISVELEYLYFLLETGWIGNDSRSLFEAGDFANGSNPGQHAFTINVESGCHLFRVVD